MKKFYPLIFIFFTVQFTFGQSFQFNRQIKGVELPTSNVNGILQDDEGLMWFNTSDGVFKSDGFSTFPIPDSISLKMTNKTRLFKDQEGIVWISNQLKEQKAFFYLKGKWGELTFPEEISKLNRTYLDFAVVGNGNQKYYHAIFADALWTYNVSSNHWQEIRHPFQTFGGMVSASFHNGKSYLFFEEKTFTVEGTLLVEVTPTGIALPSQVLYVKYCPIRKEYYYLGKDFLARGKEFLEVEEIIHQDFVRNIYSAVDYSALQVENAKVYYFYNSQLHKYNPENGNIQEISAAEAVKSYNIYASFVDREGIAWIGTHRGLVNINSLLFLNYDSRSFLEDEVTAIIKLASEKYLLGFNNGLQLFDQGTFIKLKHEEALVGQPRNRVTNFSMDKNGVVWISSNLAGIGRYNPQSGSLIFEESPLDKFVTAVEAIGDTLIVVSRDKVYLSDINKRSGHFENDITEMILTRLSQEEVFLRKVGRLNDGRYIFLQGGNVFVQEIFFETPNFINVIGFDYLEHEGKLYLGTETGLKIYENGQVKLFEKNGQAIRRPVYALLLDSSNRIWAGTDQGVFLVEEESIRKFDESSGLVGSEVNRGALIEAEDGAVLIGTQRGLSVFFPEEDEKRDFTPATEILNISLLNKNIREVNLDRIAFENNSIEVTYRAISFLQFSDLIVNYKLLGYHEEWQQIINPRVNTLVFNNLPPGEYVLQLQASLGGQYESEIVSSRSFRILKPIYLQTWFVILLLLIFAGIGFLLNALMNQWRKQNLLKQTIDEKIKEAFVNENQFRNVWNSSADGLMLSVEGGKILTVNPSLAILTGMEKEQLEQLEIKDMYADPDYYFQQRELVLGKIGNSEEIGITLEMEMPFKNGVKFIELYVARLKTSFQGKSVILSVFRDVTEKKQYEESLKMAKEKAEEANRLKTNFLSNMSHEIRTPLNGILGGTENIMDKWGHEKGLISELEIIKESGERLLETINGILDLSKIEANKFEVFLKETNVNDFVGKILLPLKTLAMKKELLLSAKYETKPFVAFIDQRYLEMIINNLVGNAIKYSNEGLINVKIERIADKLHLEVKDMGIGMSEEFMTKLFRPFEQESEGYGRKYEGTGLGLAITKNLIDLLGGEIQIESIKGNGTHVKVVLPLSKI
ncbi:PAS domain S-box-containing protein [Belliella buryatensis]|uniref:histidine kinase n=1 Tax=Belliella buryatensis TaxID=1500549 RepID=A0A239G903_9BACT|nr:ATP-binding protein [Belliella buryatensis]SNS65182.1 PAS domain S-box-containing protein [Belliella buryatensis]